VGKWFGCALYVPKSSILFYKRTEEMDYYQLLEIEPNSSEDEVKKAFRVLAMKYHPDKNPSPQAQEYFVLLKKAYDTLSDPIMRKQYDHLLQNPETPAKPFAKTYKEPPDPKDQKRVVFYFVVGLLVFSATVIGLGYWLSLSISHSLYQEGLEAEKNNDLRLAEQKYAQALDYYYQDEDCIFRLAKIEAELGKFYPALGRIEQMVSRSRKKPNSDFLLFYAEILLRTRQFEKAKDVLGQIQTSSDKKSFLQALLTLYGLNQISKGIEMLEGLSQSSLAFEAYMEQANVLNFFGEPLRSNEVALKAQKIKPNSGLVYFIFGKNSLLLSENNLACKQFGIAVEMGYHPALAYMKAYACLDATK
jgi:curved DNA-binding protein CbpA